MIKDIIYGIIIIILSIVVSIETYYLFKINNKYKEIVNCQLPLKRENDSLTNEIEKLEITKQYEVNKALTADDSTTYMLWKQLLSK